MGPKIKKPKNWKVIPLNEVSFLDKKELKSGLFFLLAVPKTSLYL